MSQFFIDRPIFAWVLAILTMIAGALSLASLPVALYPEIASPLVTVRTTYPGASAQTIEDTVTQVIEQQITGVDNLIYMYSTSESSGAATINFAFETGTDLDIAQVQVQNKVQLALPLLPDEVQRQGVSVTKNTASILLIVGFTSEDGSMSDADMGDYVASYVKDPIGRLTGVGSVTLYGAQYAMRIWCDPAKFEQYKLNPADVIAAIHEQNNQNTGGQVGASPAIAGQEINFTVTSSSRLRLTEEFENILIRTNSDGSLLRLKDVARIELNSEQFTSEARNSGKPAVGMQVKLASGANALETAALVKNTLQSLSEFFPSGLSIVYPYDSTLFVEISIKAVFKTLLEAIVLVFFVMYLFLQNIRATIIPTIAIPVVLLGTFFVLAACGFTINTLTMFGMVLAIGLLVDDAIVVVENVERLMREEKLDPKAAAKKSMRQITGALVGVAMVIAAVFVPMAFMEGSTGVVYRQFSLTIAVAMGLSALVALILSPALCATLLLPHQENHKKTLLSRFNSWFERLTQSYERRVAKLLARPWRYVCLFAAGVVVMAFLFTRLPTSFLPDEDQGVIFALVQLPPGATFERTHEVLSTVSQHFYDEEGEVLDTLFTVAGESFLGTGQNTGQAFITFRDWNSRMGKGKSVNEMMDRARRRFSAYADARVFFVAPPPAVELGNATGFVFELQDRAGKGHAALMEARNMMLGMAAQHPDILYARPNGLDDVEQYTLDVDLAKAGALGLRKGDIDAAIAAYWGGVYVNDFLDKGRTKKVYLQADAPFRMQASDFSKYHIRNEYGDMVPFASVLTVGSAMGSPRLERFNGLPAVELAGEPFFGKSSGQAMEAMEELMKGLPAGFGYSWSGLSYQEKQAGDQSFLLYSLSLAVVFLCLAALYESWSIPLSVLAVVPTGVIGALAGVYLRGMSNDVYFQVGLMTVIGLSAKNSILIVEFAKEQYESGQDIIAATLAAVRMRLRPIIMTSMAFVMGVVPLAISTDAGAGAQNAVGTTVVFGVLSATILGIFFTPLFYVLISKCAARLKRGKPLALQRPA